MSPTRLNVGYGGKYEIWLKWAEVAKDSYIFYLIFTTPDLGLILKFDPRGSRDGPLKGKLGQISKRYTLIINSST